MVIIIFTSDAKGSEGEGLQRIVSKADAVGPTSLAMS
jgi:hypothetical protein